MNALVSRNHFPVEKGQKINTLNGAILDESRNDTATQCKHEFEPQSVYRIKDHI